MPQRRTNEEIAAELEHLAEALSLLSVHTRLRILAQELKPPPDWPETNRSSHYSG